MNDVSELLPTGPYIIFKFFETNVLAQHSHAVQANTKRRQKRPPPAVSRPRRIDAVFCVHAVATRLHGHHWRPTRTRAKVPRDPPTVHRSVLPQVVPSAPGPRPGNSNQTRRRLEALRVRMRRIVAHVCHCPVQSGPFVSQECLRVKSPCRIIKQTSLKRVLNGFKLCLRMGCLDATRGAPPTDGSTASTVTGRCEPTASSI